MKKLDVERHTGPMFVAIIALAVLGFMGYILVILASEDWSFFWRLFLALIAAATFFSSPWWAAWLWNAYIADEEQFYD